MSKTSPFNYSSNPDIAAIQASIALKANIASPTFTGIVTLPGNPSTDLGAATKSYVDAGLQGLSPKPAPAVATTTTLPAYSYNNGSSGVGATITMTATGVVAIDGRNLVLNDLVLVKNEIAGNAPYNGLFDVTIAGAVGVALVLRRNTSMDIPTEFSGAYLLVNGGTINTGSGWWCTNSSAPTVGTTAITFSQFNGASSVTAGTGLTKVGNTLSIDSTVATLTGSQALTNKTVNGLTPTALATGFTLAGGTTSKTLTVPLDASVSGTNTGDQTTISGNAGTATALQTARTIGGVSFDGTANTTVSSATGGFTISGGNLAVGANNITGTGSLGATASRLTKGWFTDLQVTNAIAGSVTGSAATLTTTRAIYGNNFDGSAALAQVIASTYGGTGNGFAKLSGPATAEKTFTLPDASATILTDNTAVTVAQGGSGRASTTAYAVICGGTTSTGAEQSIASVGTAGQFLKSAGAAALPTFASFTAPTTQKFTSGSGTYTTPANVIYLQIMLVGGGGGGSGSGTTPGAGGQGGSTTFGTALLTCTGGQSATGTSAAGAATGGNIVNMVGVAGTVNGSANTNLYGGCGGTGPWGGNGQGGNNAPSGGSSATVNSGAGGGGGGSAGTGPTGTGGGSGGYIIHGIAAPAATYAYAVGAAGAGGTAGTSGSAGGAGGSGYIVVTEYYQ